MQASTSTTPARSCPMSTPQTSALVEERPCCRICRTTSLSINRRSCRLAGFDFCFIAPPLPEPTPPELFARRHTECKQSPVRRCEQQKSRTKAVPIHSAAFRQVPSLLYNSGATPRFEAAHLFGIVRLRMEYLRRARIALPLLHMMDRQTSAPHRR